MRSGLHIPVGTSIAIGGMVDLHNAAVRPHEIDAIRETSPLLPNETFSQTELHATREKAHLLLALSRQITRDILQHHTPVVVVDPEIGNFEADGPIQMTAIRIGGARLVDHAVNDKVL
jgi:hypothetical protein